MRIVGGSFGVSGRVNIEPSGALVIKGAKKMQYRHGEIKSAEARVVKQRKFGALGFVVGALLLGVLFGLFLGVLGVVIAVVFAAAGSFYSQKNNIVDIRFDDGKLVSIVCTRRDVDGLLALA